MVGEPTLIHTLQDISDTLDRATELFAKNGHVAGFDFLNSVKFVPDGSLPSDPLSPEYKNYMLDLYKTISGKPGYDPESFEKANISLSDALINPWPYQSKDAAVVGSYFMGVAHLTRVLGIFGCKTVFEYGTGWGYTATMMAQAGLAVTACDIEPVFLDRLTAISATQNIPLATFQGRFGDIPDGKRFDAFVFYECFHHCFDFIEVIPKLKAALNPGGKILLGGEPMLAKDDPAWSLRTDGHALWAIRSHGWMELGFREDFLIDVFKSNGFTCTAHPCEASGASGFIYAFHLEG
ncbi:class I SAM-dependent methyltransferase [Agrobacterium sp. MCAB5]|uniref:class I SAM-dependent methyltransferase n=1 Tax=Agrobacterium sp. MCAB5 TaxID=3233042 RepID=UPI003F8E5EB0